MKTLKNLLKPFYVGFVFVAIGATTLIKKSIFVFKIKSQYKNIPKLNKSTQKMYALVFNPYRIPNGIRHNFNTFHDASLRDAQKCHDIIQQKKTLA